MKRFVWSCPLGAIILINIAAALDYNDLFLDYPGPYCEKRGSCCDHRQDNCSLPISSTLCYCDEFCDRSRTGDCCPDYMSFCKNAPSPIITCIYNKKYYKQFDTLQDNCNTCTCLQGKMECTSHTCLVDEAIIDNINSISKSVGWHAKSYPEFWGKKFSEGLNLRLGTKEPSYRTRSMLRMTNKMEKLPKNFNANDHWSGLVSEVRDQGWCGSSWVISTASVASDRYAIQSKGREIVLLSPQNILSCARRQRGCNGGHIDVAWRYLNKEGVVDEACLPYKEAPTVCRFHRIHSLDVAGCSLPTKVARKHFYTMGPAYSLNNETDIMIEIIESGPVQASMRVYRDFFSYSGGIYRHTAASRSEQYGFHSVRLVGWGEENLGYTTVKFWIAVNSWGTWWGENGYFRILRGSNECKIEDYVLASWPHVYNPNTNNIKKKKL